MATMKLACSALVSALKSAAADPDHVSPIETALFQGADVELSVADGGAVTLADAGLGARRGAAKPKARKAPARKKAAKKAVKKAKKRSVPMIPRKRR